MDADYRPEPRGYTHAPNHPIGWVHHLPRDRHAGHGLARRLHRHPSHLSPPASSRQGVGARCFQGARSHSWPRRASRPPGRNAHLRRGHRDRALPLHRLPRPRRHRNPGATGHAAFRPPRPRALRASSSPATIAPAGTMPPGRCARDAALGGSTPVSPPRFATTSTTTSSTRAPQPSSAATTRPRTDEPRHPRGECACEGDSQPRGRGRRRLRP